MFSIRRTLAQFALVTCFAAAAMAQTAPESKPKAQVPADKKAFIAARKNEDPTQRLAALRQFTAEYPKSTRVPRAQELIFETLLKSYPERVAEIDKQAKLVLKANKKSEDSYRPYMAMELAEAGTNGVDLKLAESWAQKGVKDSTEALFDDKVLKEAKKGGYPTPKPDQLRRYFGQQRASNLAALADVYIDQGKLDQAAPLLTEAQSVFPHSDDVYMLQARIALAKGNKAEALDDFEHARMVGALDIKYRSRMIELYKEAHGGSDAGLDAELDALYRQIFKFPYTPGTHPNAASGHTVLLELFTGSACGPCVGGDLAVEGVLESYPRTEVVALAFDQHIPDPDPLANADSVARADVFDVKSTPSYVLDGANLGIYGEQREGSEKLYKQLTELLDKEASTSSMVKLHLSAERTGEDGVSAKAVVEAGGDDALKQQLDRKIQVDPTPDPAEAAPAKKKETKKPAKPTAPAAPAAAPQPHLVVNFALVEDDVLYSGENGIRYHRMVVRSLAKPAGDGFPVETGKSATFEASFEPKEISGKLSQYLTEFEKGNDRFDKFEFISKDTHIDPKHLSIAAWVQDTTSHRILQSAFTPLGSGE